MHRWLVPLLLAGCTTADGVPPVPTFNDDKADGAATPACSLEWWSWLNSTYLPMLDRPSDEVSDDDLARAAAEAPALGETPHTYSACFQGALYEYVFAPAGAQLSAAFKTFIEDQDYAAYLTHAAPSPELVRNAKAIAAIKPSAMDREAYHAWMVAYSSLLMPIVQPVGVPGPNGFLYVQEPEWVFDAPDQAYASMLEAALSPSDQDGSLEAWLEDYNRWLFRGGNNGTSYVFNLDHAYGTSGVALGGSGWYIPAPVRAFLDRYQATRPDAVGDSDHASWMSLYQAYALRMAGDVGNAQAYQLDDLMLKTIEDVRPDRVEGLFSYQTWLKLAVVPALATRVASAKPCVTAADLAAATTSFKMSGAPASAAPAVCSL
jgi:hypothetical protein